jgi:hypothetical protein
MVETENGVVIIVIVRTQLDLANPPANAPVFQCLFRIESGHDYDPERAYVG